ncbi:MAG: AMP-binding protein, partial [candidate division WOR-3 bacterium]
MEKVSNLWEMLEASAGNFSGSVALQARRGGEWRRFTYEELLSASRSFASHLQAMGVRPGDRIGLLSENSPYWGMAFFGTLGAGAIVVPLDAGLKPQEMRFVLEDSAVSHLVCSERFLSPAREIGISGLTLAEEIPGLPPAPGFRPDPPHRPPPASSSRQLRHPPLRGDPRRVRPPCARVGGGGRRPDGQ